MGVGNINAGNAMDRTVWNGETVDRGAGRQSMHGQQVESEGSEMVMSVGLCFVLAVLAACLGPVRCGLAVSGG